VREAGVVPLKAVMSIPGTIDEVALVLVDIPRRRDWISNFDESVLLERTNDYDQTEYLRVFVPWPAQNRTAVIRARVALSDDRGPVGGLPSGRSAAEAGAGADSREHVSDDAGGKPCRSRGAGLHRSLRQHPEVDREPFQPARGARDPGRAASAGGAQALFPGAA